MALHPDFPVDPYITIDPKLRWYPGEAELPADEAAKLVPPLVARVRQGVHEWRADSYRGVSETSRTLLNYWFGGPHIVNFGGSESEFQYYFAQREAVEAVVWLYEHESAHDPYSLIRYDSTGLVSQGMFDETWTRYVLKLATGAGKTKVLSLLIAWSYFHKLYEPDSTLSTNFLLLAPNIIVLDRLKDDFGGLKIFFEDPILPPNGLGGRNWHDDFGLTLHIQDEVHAVANSGNLFLSNVQRIYEPPSAPSFSDLDRADYFLGTPVRGKTNDRPLDLGDVIHSVDDLVVLNDEAHHIHDEGLAWFKAIRALDSGLKRRTGRGLSAQLDVSATPKAVNGGIFVQTVCSYPLVEAIRQRVVKTPVVPDEVSRSKLQEHVSESFAERFADHLKLGYLEWDKRREGLEAVGGKPVLFVMVNTTREADEVGEYLQKAFPELTDAVLIIHTKANGEITEKDLESLREASREIDSPDSPYKAVVSVLMLREGWDVKNVVSMVGLRPYSATSKILPEQTLGRGLRRMFRDQTELVERVSVVGTPAFLEFVESLRDEGIDLERVPMGQGSKPKAPILIEVDKFDDGLDIPLPRLSPRIQRKYKNLDELDPSTLSHREFAVRQFSDEEQRNIVFKDLDTDETSHSTDLGVNVPARQQPVLTQLSREVMRRLRLVAGQDAIYGQMKSFIRDFLFGMPVNLDDTNILRNLSEQDIRREILEAFGRAINSLTVSDNGSGEIVGLLKLAATRPILVNDQEFITSDKTLFNKVVGDSHLELRFAHFLDRVPDVRAFAKNLIGLHFKIEYANASGAISHYHPDFMVKTTGDTVWIVETKGLEDIEVVPKWNRLVAWCSDATRLDPLNRQFRALYVPQDAFNDLEGLTSFELLTDSLKGVTPKGAAKAG